MLFRSKELLLQPYMPNTEVGEDTTAGTYTYKIQPGKYLISLIGGGGGSAQVDGGTDAYSDTGWSWHYGKTGGAGAVFEGYAQLQKGTLTITVGAVGTNRAGKGNTAGNGGDSYAVFIPENGSAVEIARAGGGHSGYPDGSAWYDTVPGGKVTYNSKYIIEVITNQDGANGYDNWSARI